MGLLLIADGVSTANAFAMPFNLFVSIKMKIIDTSVVFRFIFVVQPSSHSHIHKDYAIYIRRPEFVRVNRMQTGQNVLCVVSLIDKTRL